ncbi:hypothetical protein [Clostridioides sp. ZZV14-6044]|uniref:hypothetical protein n=1 Tax=unclassified Clostridioides TaxID=2635829 RepID=UPI001D118D5C|nr:hypothetical protein [Clostridioides sp. ZZV14-6104]MCC0744603.1 hypothetical protein [Clostridioides sp. ZZV14-6044]
MIKNNDLSYEEKIKALKERGYSDFTKEYILEVLGEEHKFYKTLSEKLDEKDDKKVVLIKRFKESVQYFSKGFIESHTLKEILDIERRNHGNLEDCKHLEISNNLNIVSRLLNFIHRIFCGCKIH